jgi:serine/threonine protein kinase
MASDAESGGNDRPTEHDGLRRLGKYEIQRKLGAGGMGTVFLAIDDQLKRTVALKVLPKDRAENPTLVKRFKAEGHAAAHLHHKNIVSVYEAGEIDGFLYIALEFIEGTDVLDMIRKRGPFPIKRSIDIVRQVTEALQHAFEKQIVHRDIKPSNLLIKKDGSVKLADLGLARSIDDTLDTAITRAGTTVGTVDYMSPEQARNSKATDIRSDIYSLGCTWYHMLTGVPPFGEGSMTNKLQAHAISPPPDPRDRNDRVPEGVVAVIHRMMAKKPQDRYQTPAELLEDLKNPVLSRGGLDADVLAALAGPKAASDESVDVDAQFDEPEHDTHEAAIDTEVRTETEAEAKANKWSRKKGKPEAPERDVALDERSLDSGKAKSKKPRSRARRGEPDSSPEIEESRRQFARREDREEPNGKRRLPERDAPAESEEDESWKTATYRRSSPGTPDPERSKLPPRNARSSRSLSDSGKVPLTREEKAENFKRKRLPRRSTDEPVGNSGSARSIDPDTLKYGAAALLVVAALGGLGYYFWSTMGGASNSAVTPGIDPYAAPTALQGAPTAPDPAAIPTEESPQQNPEAGGGLGKPEQSSVPLADSAVAELRKSADKLVGADDLDLSSAAGRDYVKDWVFSVRKQAVPSNSPIVVNRDANSPGELHTLAEAAAKLPPGDAVIELVGDGPYVFQHVELPARPRLVIRGHGSSQPVVIFATNTLKAGESCLKFSGEVLALEKLNLVMSCPAEVADDVTLVTASSVTLRDCTVSQLGPSLKPATAFHLTGTDGDSGAVFENTTIRGPALTAARLAGGHTSLLFSNCLVTSGAVPAVVMSSDAKAGGDPRARSISVLSSTIASAGFAWLQGVSDGKTSPCDLRARKATFIAEPGTQSAWLKASPWPKAAPDQLDHPLAVGLSWQADRAVFAGWSRLVHFETATSERFDVSDDAGWKQFWRQEATTLDVKPAPPSPIGATSSGDLAGVLETAGFKGSGCAVEQLPRPPEGAFARAVALSNRKRIPGDFFAFRAPTLTIELEFSKIGTLDNLLNDSAKCPDGALIRVKGAGIKSLPRLTVRGKSVHLEFVQEEGSPLSIRPQSGGDAGNPAWITVENGSIDITNGSFFLPDPDKASNPKTLLQVRGGNFSLRRCNATGAFEKSSRRSPLITWTGSPHSAAFIENCMLAGGAAVVFAEIPGGILEVRNCALASLDDALQLTSGTGAEAGTLAVLNSSLAAGQSIFRFGPQGKFEGSVFLSNDVYLPPFGGRGNPSVLAADPSQLSAIQWWEDGIGYGPALKQIFATSMAATTSAEAAIPAWRNQWGEGHVLRPLADPLGIAVERPLGEIEKAVPDLFELSPRCLAATWSATGGRIGAVIEEIGPAATEPDAAKTNPQSNTPASAPPGGFRRPGNPGF